MLIPGSQSTPFARAVTPSLSPIWLNLNIISFQHLFSLTNLGVNIGTLQDHDSSKDASPSRRSFFWTASYHYWGIRVGIGGYSQGSLRDSPVIDPD
jgi:hypothetical protein